MDPVSVFPVVAALLVAVFVAKIIALFAGPPPSHGRTSSIDGLRGYLAFCVFLHHSSVWYFYLHTGEWRAPPSNLYVNLGRSSVVLFFMITAFLFFNKILDADAKAIDWGKLFFSRLLRIAPLYVVVMLLMLLVVAALSDWAWREAPLKVLLEAFRWITFTVFGEPDVNRAGGTKMIVAGVTWSLAYEWGFYFLLPVLALAMRKNPPRIAVIFGLAGFAAVFAGILLNGALPIHFVVFGGGIAAAFLARRARFRAFAGTHLASGIVMLSLLATVFLFSTPNGVIPLLLLTVAFSLIAAGNTLFGVFVAASSRTIGELAYSIYLLHGIILFVTFKFLLGFSMAKAMTPLAYWAMILAVAPVLIGVSYVTFTWIESPPMKNVASLRRRLSATVFKRATAP